MAGRFALGLAAALAAGCANAGEPAAPADAPPVQGDGSGSNTPHACPAGQLATNIATNGDVTCTPITTSTHDAIAASCSTYFGWRDTCSGCTSVPAKYGNAGGTCSTGVGTDNTCTMQNLGGANVLLFGLNTDGDVNDDDTFYSTLHCAPPAATSSPAPCAAGEFVTGFDGTRWTCAPLASVAVDYVRTKCSLYLGWQDSCDGCTTLPAKWGHAGDTGCQAGAGINNTCTTAVLGGESVMLFGLNTDGDVNDDDKLYVGLDCGAASPATTSATTMCPAGQFVTATSTDASFQCTSPAPLVHDYVIQHCSVYLGWRDGCDGCTLAPAKWGSTKVGSCTLGTGVNDTCGKFMLGGVEVDMLGLNTDGDVDGNDTFYMKLHCE